jgi:rare lipoprotein A (peptidoglycan hydrolase)
MPRFGFGRTTTALIASGALTLLGFQSLAFAANPETPGGPAVMYLRPLPIANSVVSTAPQMNAAVPSGQFEDLVKPTPVPTVAPTRVPTAIPTPAPTGASKPVVFETGIASTYGEGDGFEGNLTACGQVFHTNVVQIAHKSLPCGTMVRVEDTDTGKTVVAEVTDRGPYITGRIVDLSWGAFEQLDPTGPGLLHVNVYLLNQ